MTPTAAFRRSKELFDDYSRYRIGGCEPSAAVECVAAEHLLDAKVARAAIIEGGARFLPAA